MVSRRGLDVHGTANLVYLSMARDTNTNEKRADRHPRLAICRTTILRDKEKQKSNTWNLEKIPFRVSPSSSSLSQHSDKAQIRRRRRRNDSGDKQARYLRALFSENKSDDKKENGTRSIEASREDNRKYQSRQKKKRKRRRKERRNFIFRRGVEPARTFSGKRGADSRVTSPRKYGRMPLPAAWD